MKTHRYLLAASAVSLMAGRAFADLNFDATTVEPDAGFSGDPLPAGWYNVQADESNKKPTKDGTGEFLEVRFSLMDGQFAGRKVYTNFNLKNTSAQAVEIGQKQLSAFCHAVNVLRPQKSEELHAKPLKIKVGLKPAQGDYPASNKIQAYKNINENVDLAGGDTAAAPAGFTSGAAAAVAAPAAAAVAPAAWAPTPAAAAVTEAPAAPAAPALPAPVEAPAPAHDPMAAALADGWIQHPSSPPHVYKGQEVKTHDEVKAMYPAPAPSAAPALPAAPPAAPAAPAADPAAVAGAQTAAPPWAAPKA